MTINLILYQQKSEIFCIHAAVMAQLETISYPERRNRRGNPLKGPENWRITVWQECTSNIINQQENGIDIHLHTHKSLTWTGGVQVPPLPLSVRKEIQEKFAQGVTLERIMDGI